LKMAYSAFEKLSYEQLLKEAQVFKLHPIPNNRDNLLAGLINHLEDYGSLNEARSVQGGKSTPSGEPAIQAATGSVKKIIHSPVARRNNSDSTSVCTDTDTLATATTTITTTATATASNARPVEKNLWTKLPLRYKLPILVNKRNKGFVI